MSATGALASAKITHPVCGVHFPARFAASLKERADRFEFNSGIFVNFALRRVACRGRQFLGLDT